MMFLLPLFEARIQGRTEANTSFSAIEDGVDVRRLINAEDWVGEDDVGHGAGDGDHNVKNTNLVTTLGKWHMKNMTTVEMRMMARLQSRDCWVALRSRSLSEGENVCRRKGKMKTNKPVVELLLTVFLPSSRRQRRLLKLSELHEIHGINGRDIRDGKECVLVSGFVFFCAWLVRWGWGGKVSPGENSQVEENQDHQGNQPWDF